MRDIEYKEIDLGAELRARAKLKTPWPLDLSKAPTLFPASLGFHEHTEEKLPPEAVWKTEFRNNTSLTVTQHLNIGEMLTTTDTLAITFTSGAQATFGMNFSIGIPGEFGLGFSTNQQFSYSNGTQNIKAASTQRSWNYNTDVPIGANKTVHVEIMVIKSVLTFPFNCTVKVVGEVVGKNQNHNLVVPIPHDDHLPVGQLFREKPHPEIRVVDDHTIECTLAGKVVGVLGTSLSVVASEVNPLSGKLLDSETLFEIQEGSERSRE